MSEIQIPLIVLDGLLERENVLAISLTNITPEIDTGVVRDANPAFHISALDGGDISIPDTRVWVSYNSATEILIYDGAEVSPFTLAAPGPDTTIETIGPEEIRFVLDIPETESETLVTVRVESLTALGAILNSQFSYTSEDLSPPRLLSAASVGSNTIELHFSEDISAVSLASGYTIERAEPYAVNTTAATVALLHSSVVQLTTTAELSPGRLYTVTATGTEDLSGNEILAPYNRVEFVALNKNLKAGREFDLISMVPELNLNEDRSGDLRKFLTVLQEPLDLLLCDVDEFTGILDPDVAEEKWVDAMLADLGNPFSFPLGLVDKRRLARLLIPIYQQKGTCVGIQNAARFFAGLELTCDAYNGGNTWILGESALGEETELGPSLEFLIYSFTLVSPIALTVAQREQITAIARYMKPAHTHFLGIIEPVIPDTIDHLELGRSELGVNWQLH